MLTSVPPSWLHYVRDTAAYVHDLAQLGLEMLCPCEDGHGERRSWLSHDDFADPEPVLRATYGAQNCRETAQ